MATEYSPIAIPHIEGSTALASGRVVGRFGRYAIASAFQPIYSLSHHRVVGHEALLRAWDPRGSPVPPTSLFDPDREMSEWIFLDRLCRNLHVRNFLPDSSPREWLFLNVHASVAVRGRHYGPYFADLLSRYGLPPERVVIEILEDGREDEALLAHSVHYFKELGCLVAIDDFGAGHSNFERLWRVRPHIVKLDRSLIEQAARFPAPRRALPGLISLLHGSGCLALVEGVETEEQALIAFEAGADLAQGYYLGRPAEQLTRDDGTLPALTERFRESTRHAADDFQNAVQPYFTLFQTAAQRMRWGEGEEEACAELLEKPRVERCYFLDAAGRQPRPNLAGARTRQADPRFMPLLQSEGAVWARRDYFRQALGHPGVTQITTPYLSISGGNLCVTLSVLLNIHGESYVFCVDLDWSDKE